MARVARSTRAAVSRGETSVPGGISRLECRAQGLRAVRRPYVLARSRSNPLVEGARRAQESLLAARGENQSSGARVVRIHAPLHVAVTHHRRPPILAAPWGVRCSRAASCVAVRGSAASARSTYPNDAPRSVKPRSLQIGPQGFDKVLIGQAEQDPEVLVPNGRP